MAAPGHAREAKIVEVMIKPGHTPGVDPEPFHLSKSGNDQVKWMTASGTHFTVEFVGESPFYEGQFNNDFPYSGLVRREVLADSRKEYKYVVHTDHGDVDPTGIIDP